MSLPGLVPTEVRSLGYILLAIVAARVGEDVIPRGVPFLEVLVSLGSDHRWAQGLSLGFFAGAALALSGRFFRLGCMIAGACLILKVLGNMGSYSNGRLFDGLLLVLIGVCVSPLGLTLLRVQCILLYAGSSLSKFIDPDWWNGGYMSAVFDYHLTDGTAAALAPFATVAGIGSMFMEAAIGVLLSIPGTRNLGVILVASFHTAILLLLNEDFATFYYSVAASAALLFIRLPAIHSVMAPFPQLAGLSVFSAVRSAPFENGRSQVAFENVSLRGFPALLLLLLSNLPLLASIVAIASYCGRLELSAARNTILLLTVVASMFLLLAARRQRVSLAQPAVVV